MNFRLLGPLEVSTDTGPLKLGPQKQRALLALLLFRANEVVPRELAIDSLWGDEPPDRAANALQVYVHGLRKLLGHDRITRRGTGYCLHVESEELDILRFELLLDQAQSAYSMGEPEVAGVKLGAALGLWRGPPLSDLPYGVVDEAARERLGERRLRALELEGDIHLALGRHEDAVAGLEALVVEHPYRERFRGQLMLALYRAGRQADALAVFRATRLLVSDELGLEPSPALSELERAILRQDPSLALVRERSRLRLPKSRTRLVGRHLDVVAIAAHLRGTGARILTLVGAGGIGKTRLAVEAAAQLGTELSDGAYFVDLAPLADPALVGATIAAAVGVSEEQGPQAVDAVIARLRDREAVIVLDNFERLLEASQLVARLVDAAPALRVLVTSRTPLRIGGEQVYNVIPLATPGEGETFESLARNDSVAIFVARARAVDREFQLADENADDVAAICRSLEGLPLALELAATRVNVLTPAQIHKRLAAPLALLGGGDRDAPERQQTLKATIDWSYELLDERERRLFASLGVFAGGCTLAAAETVCDADLASLSALLDNSLLSREQALGAEPRFRMLDVVRDYALDRLEDGDAATLRDRHLAFFAELAEQLGSSIVGPRGPEVLTRLAREHENLRMALAHSLTSDPEPGFRIAGALGPYWDTSARSREIRAWLERAFGERRSATTQAQVGALVVLGQRLLNDGEYRESRTALEVAIGAGAEFDRPSSVAVALTYLAWLSAAEGDHDMCLELAEQAVDLAKRSRSRWAERQGLAMIAGTLINRGEYEQATSYLERSLRVARRLEDRRTLVTALVNSGYGALCAGHLERAREFLEEGLTVSRELDHAGSTVSALIPLAWASNDAGEAEHARVLLREALESLRRGGRYRYLVEVVDETAVSLEQAEPKIAGRLLGAADAGYAAEHRRRAMPAKARYEGLRSRLAERIGPRDLAEALDEGASLTLDEAIVAALEALEPRSRVRV
ncbi:MAG: BTAD domain-containing putative transcriptional regulator [Gaiellaceae bacterium]